MSFIYQKFPGRISVVALAVVTFVLYFVNLYNSSSDVPLNYVSSTYNVSKLLTGEAYKYGDLIFTSLQVQKLLAWQRFKIKEEMLGYTFHDSTGFSKLTDFVMEEGGRPVRNMVISTWRSGSTFIGDVLLSHPATFYHYEPLLDFGIIQIRGGDSASGALRNLRQLFYCNYTDMDHYLEYGKTHPFLFQHNVRLWEVCTREGLCWNPSFLTPFCRLFPFQSMKTVRLRLNLTSQFLEDKDLGVRVLFLVRDPRATLQSRHFRDWCPGQPDCDEPSHLCNDLVNDYYTAVDFIKRFPDSFKVYRYEDISLDAYNVTRDLLDFFRLSYVENIKQFLDSHTKESIGGVSSTFRNSKTAPIHWTKEMPWEEVRHVQKHCLKALRLWGYNVAASAKNLLTFNPIGVFRI